MVAGRDEDREINRDEWERIGDREVGKLFFFLIFVILIMLILKRINL